MKLHREAMRKLGVKSAAEVKRARGGQWVRAGGCVICRQRPGTAKGFLFISLEDETGIANVIVTPDMFTEYRTVIVSEPYPLVEGVLQNQEGVIHVRARRIEALPLGAVMVESRDFR